LAGELESMIHQRAAFDAIEPQLNMFASLQATMVTAIRAALPTTAEKSVPIDEATLSNILRSLAVALADNDSEANDILESNFDVLRSAADHEGFKALEGAIARFDYEAALNHVMQIASLRKIALDIPVLPS
jgi:two-component system sensor histidine kinase/response regulator